MCSAWGGDLLSNFSVILRRRRARPGEEFLNFGYF
jgi:hypothetical protein